MPDGAAHPTPDPAAFRAAMRNVASSVTVVTTAQGGMRFGMTATAVASLTADPPQVLVCINRTNRCCEAMSEAFAINVLPAGAQELANRFANPAIDYPDRFAAGRWTTIASGAPVLEDAAAVFDCALADSHDHGTHRILIGRVLGVRHSPSAPLLYHDGLYRAVAPA